MFWSGFLFFFLWHKIYWYYLLLSSLSYSAVVTLKASIFTVSSLKARETLGYYWFSYAEKFLAHKEALENNDIRKCPVRANYCQPLIQS